MYCNNNRRKETGKTRSIHAEHTFQRKTGESCGGNHPRGASGTHRISRRNLFVDWNDTILYGNDDLEHRPLGNGDRVNLFSMVGGG